MRTATRRGSRSRGSLEPSLTPTTRSSTVGQLIVEGRPTFRWPPLPVGLLLVLVAAGQQQLSTGAQLIKSSPVASLSPQQQQQQPQLAAAVASPTPTTGPSGPNAPRTPSNREIEKQIVDRILGEGYDKRIRPAGPRNNTSGNNNGPTIVKVNTFVRSISKIDDVTMEYSVQLTLRQEWIDDRLAFRKMDQYKNYTNLNSITLTEQERIWKPDLFFRNEKEGHFHKIIMPNVLLRIKGEGQVLYSIRISLVLACPMDLKYYPLDKQNCTIEMASYGYTDDDLKFLWKEIQPIQMAKPLNLPRFTLETHETAYCTSTTTTGAYSCLRIDLIFKREFSYYLIQIYIPCCMLVIVSWVSFWLDPNAIPARVSLGVTTLLTMATQISGINASLPPVSYIKAIDVWTGVCLTFVFGALLEFALVNYASRGDQHKRELRSNLTVTQQLRWREAQAAAAAAGVAPPSSPPIDENSPSMLAHKKQQAFFGPMMPLTLPLGPVTAATTAAASAVGCLAHPRAAGAAGAAAAAAAASQRLQAGHNNASFRPHHNSIVCGQPQNSTQGGQSTLPRNGGINSNSNNNNGPIATLGRMATGQQHHQQQQNIANQKFAYGSGACGAPMANGGQRVIANGLACTQLHEAGPNCAKIPPTQINCALQHSQQSPSEAYLSDKDEEETSTNCFCRWWKKHSSFSKRIDVISRFSFPLVFAIFNIFYWFTYLFREEVTPV